MVAAMSNNNDTSLLLTLPSTVATGALPILVGPDGSTLAGQCLCRCLDRRRMRMLDEAAAGGVGG